MLCQFQRIWWSTNIGKKLDTQGFEKLGSILPEIGWCTINKINYFSGEMVPGIHHC